MGPSSGDIILSLSIALAAVLAVTRRVPLAAALALPAAAAAGRMFGTATRLLPGEGLILAEIVLLPIPFGILTAWAALRCFYWIPDRLTAPEDSPRVAETERLKRLSELGALGFRPVGWLCLRDGFERQDRQYFLHPDGISACVIRNRWGIRGITFCTEQDGARLVTSDWPSIPMFPLLPGKTIFLHQLGRSPKELLRNHRLHLAELAMDAPDPCNDLLAREQVRFEEDAKEAVRRGRLVRDRRGRLRVTLRAMPALLCRTFFLDFRRKRWRFDR